VIFALIRGDQNCRIIMDEHGRHDAMASARAATRGDEVTGNIKRYSDYLKRGI